MRPQARLVHPFTAKNETLSLVDCDGFRVDTGDDVNRVAVRSRVNP
jgi:hypothetical protein